MGLSLALLAALCVPQSTDEAVLGSSAVLVAGVVDAGRLPLAALGLGDGGVGEPRATGRLRNGQLVTPGGILVRAQVEGVKFDFPSGRELLVSPRAAVHLRDGGHTAPSLHGLEIWLADGSRVRIEREPSPRQPLRLVEVVTEVGTTLLWRARRRAVEASQLQRAPRQAYLALGGGDVLYRAVPLGPIVILERVLCPSGERTDRPTRRIVVCADPLADSLRRLVSHVPRRRVQFPQAVQATQRLAALADSLFPAGINALPAGPHGALVFALPHEFRLEVVDHREGPITLGLKRGDVEVPAVEWVVDVRTHLHLVRPDGGRSGGPRYFLDGLNLTPQTRDLLPVRVTHRDRERARIVLRGLGAQQVERTGLEHRR